MVNSRRIRHRLGVFQQVSTGLGHTCGVKTDGAVVCWWGVDWRDSVGDGLSTLPDPPPGDTFQQVSTGLYHTCGVKTDGAVVCWWSIDWWNYDFLNPLSTHVTRPTAGSAAGRLSAGQRWLVLHTCGVKTDGAVVCWWSIDWWNYGQFLTPINGRLSDRSALASVNRSHAPVG